MNINIELEDWMYAAIASEAQNLGCSETEVIQNAIKLMFGIDESSLSKIIDKYLGEKLEQKLEEKLAAKFKNIDKKIDHKPTEQLDKEFTQKLQESDHPRSVSNLSPSVPTVRALQIGDLVQIRDQGSPHFLEKLSIVKVGMLMATVQTSKGEQSFLKRDLRFIESPILNSET
ncbi:hypothetical protein Syn7502_03496 [Synechococcus sp. PCC 7502]|uniref:hypothetical protein n=1 Tax=Synechococcus sp. PCC 7502 TaxID=1173263 RepID=UPI00029FACFE|nr:hypothetical protein [Synechococcus sp. PCC 7502]AFY75338.1 hypothetical protein Syn7502_03496 [Synechococcus sp. PCC 7502]